MIVKNSRVQSPGEWKNWIRTPPPLNLLVFIAALTVLAGRSLAQDSSSENLARRALERRAVEAAIWGMPIVSFDAMRQAYFRDAGARFNDVIYWSKPSDW